MEKLRSKQWNVVEGNVYSSNVCLVIKSVTGIREHWVHWWLWITWFLMWDDAWFVVHVGGGSFHKSALSAKTFSCYTFLPQNLTLSRQPSVPLCVFFSQESPQLLKCKFFILLHLLNFFFYFGVKASRSLSVVFFLLSNNDCICSLLNSYDVSLHLYALWMQLPPK